MMRLDTGNSWTTQINVIVSDVSARCVICWKRPTSHIRFHYPKVLEIRLQECESHSFVVCRRSARDNFCRCATRRQRACVRLSIITFPYMRMRGAQIVAALLLTSETVTASQELVAAVARR